MIRFGPYALDPHTGELRRGGEVVPLAPQPFRLLLTLASRPGELVTREELRQRVWGDETFVDFERGLNFCVLQARTALGDDAKNPAYIETLPKRGYRFVGTIENAASEKARPGRRRATLLVAAAALVVIVVAAWQQRSPGPAPQRTAIAVLPFDNLSGANDSHFADGMTEELITHLGRLQPQQLSVIARTSITRYRGTTKSVRDIGRELGARYIVEGSVRREGERVRVTAQLIDARDQTHLWAESFDRSGAGALAIQEDVAARIVRALRFELLDESKLATTSPAAHEAYLRGRQLWHLRDTASVEASVRELREAVRFDPKYVLAHVALAESVHTLAMRDRIPPAQAAAEIRAASDAALRLAPSLAQSHGITAMLHFWYDWDWDAAEESYRRAIELNPGEPGALHDHGWLLITRGRFDEGIAEIRRAQELDPVSPRANMHVAWAYIYTRRYADAEREAKRALQLSPGLEEAYACLNVAKGNPPPINAKAGDAYMLAAQYALSGDREDALKSLAIAKQRRDLSFPLAGIDPKLIALHGDPRFTTLLASVGLKPLEPST
ncbi:MAG TPA: winged helix-turn-helix domain-containing protein [Thermoanaerobaculia bacterium]|nr:winged helix-turn-helix domain-containing protein [Thermoanaerobaculia bacterium]